MCSMVNRQRECLILFQRYDCCNLHKKTEMTSSCRRFHVDSFLANVAPQITGRVLDIGGKKKNPRGHFRPPAGVRWEYLNLDQSTEPDHWVDAESSNLPAAAYDVFFLIEVLEHVQNPNMVLAEAYRILVPGGRGYIAMPFLYGVHGDPGDFQRWTAEKLFQELQRVGFTDIRVMPMGGPFSVAFDIFWTIAWRAKGLWIRRLAFVLLSALKPLALLADKLVPEMAQYLTTGWAVMVHKDI